MSDPRPQSGSKADMLRTKWTNLYRTTLPSLAKSRDPKQSCWPVTLDHCFARIILDNTIGKSAGPNGENLQWDKVIEKPAVRNMNEEQLKNAIELGERIASGDVDLMELDQWSLEARGKSKVAGEKRKSNGDGAKGVDAEPSKKRKKVRWDEQDAEEDSKEVKENHKGKNDSGKKQTQSTLSFQSSPTSTGSATSEDNSSNTARKMLTSRERTSDISSDPNISSDTILKTLQRIQTHPGLTPFRKRLYTSLLSVPTGQHTTYAALATHLGSVPRAVGNGMRHNPFAPVVPCHRVLASDGTLGGFFGDWGTEGKYGNEKINLLKGEGVSFNSVGKVKGMVWNNFWDLKEFESEFGEVK